MGLYQYKTTHLIWLLPAIMSFVAMIDLPYGYYHFLRLVIFFSSLFILYAHQKCGYRFEWVLLFIVIALLFNPILPVFLDKEIWSFINPIVSISYILHFVFFRKKIENFFHK